MMSTSPLPRLPPRAAAAAPPPQRTAGLAASDYGTLSSRVLGILNQLRALGISHQLSVPILVVAGNQSSGKSSVVEAIAGVNLPRAAGTCTRCPTELRLRVGKHSDSGAGGAAAAAAAAAAAMNGDGGGGATRAPAEAATPTRGGTDYWRCTVKLRYEHDADGKHLDVAHEEDFCTVYDKSQIASCVSAAQAVLLNPQRTGANRGAYAPKRGHPTAAASPAVSASVPSNGCGPGSSPNTTTNGDRHHSVAGSGSVSSSGAEQGRVLLEIPPELEALMQQREHELDFTANSVLLEIDGAEADLTIVDLPGIIQAHPKGQTYIDLVKQMTREFISHKHHIIVMTITAMDDPDNQAIKLMAQEEDPAGSRTLAVITKPDNIPSGQHDFWLRLVTRPEPADRLALGYWVVKNPGQDQLNEGITSEQARLEEQRFFRTDTHWSAAPQDRLGAGNLRHGLSDELVKQVRRQLPQISESARQQLELVHQQRAGLPPPPSNDPLFELDDLLRQIVATLACRLRPVNGLDTALYQELMAAYRKFAAALEHTMPVFYVNGRLFGALGKGSKSSAGRDDADGAGEIDVRLYLTNPSPESVRDALNTCRDRTTEQSAGALLLREALTAAGMPLGFMTLERVVEERRLHRGPELPGILPYAAVEALVKRHTTSWGNAAGELVRDVEGLVRDEVSRVVQEALASYPTAQDAAWFALSAYVDGQVAAAEDAVRRLVEIEGSDLFTQDHFYFQQQDSRQLGRLKAAYLGKDLKGEEEDDSPEAWAGKATDVDEELKMMSTTLTYFKVMVRRLQDPVPQHVCYHLVRPLADQQRLPGHLRDSLLGEAHQQHQQADGRDGREQAARRLLEEDASQAALRASLATREKRLREAVSLLQRMTLSAPERA